MAVSNIIPFPLAFVSPERRAAARELDRARDMLGARPYELGGARFALFMAAQSVTARTADNLEAWLYLMHMEGLARSPDQKAQARAARERIEQLQAA